MATSSSRGTRSAGRPPRGTRAPEQSRTDLLDAAEAVFADHGYAGATVGEVVHRSGLSKGTFYWHYDSKEALFLDLIEERIDAPARDAIDALRSDSEHPSADIGGLLAQLFDRRRTTLVLLHEYALAATRDHQLAERYQQRLRTMRSHLADALTARHAATGVPLDLPADELAQAFISLADGLTIHALTGSTSVTPDLFGRIAALVYDGLVHRAHNND